MELQKLQCTNCGANLSINPGVGQTSCDYCGTIFNVKQSKGDTISTVNGPAKLIISPTERKNTKSLMSIYSITAYPDIDEGPFSESIVKYHNKNWSDYFLFLPEKPYGYDVETSFEEAYNDLVNKIKFWAMISYLTQSTYRLVDSFELDVTPQYVNKPYTNPNATHINAADISRLTTPPAIFVNTITVEGIKIASDTTDYIDYKSGNFRFYIATQEKEVSKTRRQNILNFAQEYAFETQETTVRSLPYWEQPTVKGFFGPKKIYRLWCISMNRITIAKNMTPEIATNYLTQAEIENLNKLKCNKTVESIALGIAEPLNLGYEKLIATQSETRVSILVSNKGICLGKYELQSSKQKHGYELSLIQKGSPLTYSTSNPCVWLFHELGMKDIDDPELRRLFLAAIYALVLNNTTINGLCRFAPRLYLDDTGKQSRGAKLRFMSISLENAFKSEIKYADWI